MYLSVHTSYTHEVMMPSQKVEKSANAAESFTKQLNNPWIHPKYLIPNTWNHFTKTFYDFSNSMCSVLWRPKWWLERHIFQSVVAIIARDGKNIMKVSEVLDKSEIGITKLDTL